VSTSARVAVVVPVRNRRDLLRRTLDALDGQDFSDFEVVVVDDGSDDGSDEEACARPVAGRPVRLLRTGGVGAVRARLAAIEATDAPVLAFTDSDCEPVPGWLSAAMRHVDEGTALVHGLTLPARPTRPLERSVTERAFGLFPTCNLVVTREAYERAGGFDPATGTRWGFRLTGRAKGLGFGEDTLLGWAVARHAPSAYEEAMLVRHHVFPPDLRESFSRAWQCGAFPAMVREVPELRETVMRRGVLWGRRSRVPAYVTAVAAMTGRRQLVGLALGWWVLHRYRYTLRHSELPAMEKLRTLPVQVALDAVQATAMAAGSVRARRIVL
jgi:glycosyltransferase involved in cell wall biosynthesis